MTMDVSTIGWKSEPTEYAYGWQQVVLYALGIGAQASELDYLFEDRGPKCYPTFAVVPAISHCFACLKRAKIPLTSVVHGGQSIRRLGPLAARGTLRTHGEIVDFYDLKRFAQFIVRTESASEDGTPIFQTHWTIIVRGAGGFGGRPPPKRHEGKVPRDREPDFHIEQRTQPEQALLYRLSGDTNPLHADPDVAKAAGFDRGPILHGLATLGFSARAIVATCCDGDANRLSFVHGQFTKPVWPGDTLSTEAWRVDDRIVFQTKVPTRNDVVISNAWALVSDE